MQCIRALRPPIWITGKVLGYANGNSDTYTDPVTQKTVTNSNLSFQNADKEPLGSVRMDSMGETRKVIEFIDNQW